MTIFSSGAVFHREPLIHCLQARHEPGWRFQLCHALNLTCKCALRSEFGRLEAIYKDRSMKAASFKE